MSDVTKIRDVVRVRLVGIENGRARIHVLSFFDAPGAAPYDAFLEPGDVFTLRGPTLDSDDIPAMITDAIDAAAAVIEKVKR